MSSSKYVIFKDDDVGKDFNGLKRWIDIVLQNNAKGTIGVIGKYLKDKNLVDYLNSLDPNSIEVFCHGYSHDYLPFLVNRMFMGRRVIPVEFDRNLEDHDASLKKYMDVESKFLKTKAIAFGPPGNYWNDSTIDALVKNDFKIMFSDKKAKGDLLFIPISDRLNQDSFESFVQSYEKKKNDIIYTLQFHHAYLTEEQFNLMEKVIDFLKNKEKRAFVTPSELLGISQEDEDVFNLMSTKKKW